MKKFILLLLWLPCCLAAQEYHNSPAFKAIEAKFKLNKRRVVWHLYTEQQFADEPEGKLIVFPLEKRNTTDYDAYIVYYNTAKERIERYYIAENFWKNNETQRIQGIEISKRKPEVKPKKQAYEIRVFCSNLNRQHPVGSEQLLWLLPKGKKLKPLLNASALSYEGHISLGGNTPCKGETTEVRSSFTISAQKKRGYYLLEEQRNTQQISITPDDKGICTDKITDSKEEIFQWQYSRKGYFKD